MELHFLEYLKGLIERQAENIILAVFLAVCGALFRKYLKDIVDDSLSKKSRKKKYLFHLGFFGSGVCGSIFAFFKLYPFAMVFFSLASGMLGYAIALMVWNLNRPERLTIHMGEIRRQLANAPSGAKIVLAQAAQQTVRNLRKHDGSSYGEDLRLDEYISILNESHAYGNPDDITVFMKATPSEWFYITEWDEKTCKCVRDRGLATEVLACCCKEIEKSERRHLKNKLQKYFSTQTRLKEKYKDKLKMRRVLLMSPAAAKSDPRYDDFLKMHNESEIDLIAFSPDSLEEDNKILLDMDAALFLSKDGSGWVIRSSLAKSASINVINTYLEHSGIQDEVYDDLKTKVMQVVLSVYHQNNGNNQLEILNRGGNSPENGLLIKHRIGINEW